MGSSTSLQHNTTNMTMKFSSSKLLQLCKKSETNSETTTLTQLQLAMWKRREEKDWKYNILRMGPDMKETGSMELKMAEARNYGSTDLFMRATGKTIRLTDTEDSSMLMEMFTMENGRKIRHTDMENITTQMEPNMKVNGLKINNMAKAKKFGPIMPFTRENITMERSTVRENSTGLMGLLTQASSLTTISTGMESIPGLTAESIQAIGT